MSTDSRRESRLTGALVVTWLENYRSAIHDRSQELNRLDAALGDGDFGASMQRGLDAVVESVRPDVPIANVLQNAGATIVSAIGGTSGPLVGSLFLHAGTALVGANDCSAQEFGYALRAGADAVASLGGAAVGDKTMIDALDPAVDALVVRLAAADTFADATARAARDAERAALSTADLVARRGRASYTGTGGLGHVDPGAQGIAIMFAALAAAASTHSSANGGALSAPADAQPPTELSTH